MTPAAAAAPFPRPTATPHHNQVAFLRKAARRKTKKNNFHLHVNGGTQERNFTFLKIFFHLYVNGGTQEQKYNFIKIFFQWVGEEF